METNAPEIGQKTLPPTMSNTPLIPKATNLASAH